MKEFFKRVAYLHERRNRPILARQTFPNLGQVEHDPKEFHFYNHYHTEIMTKHQFVYWLLTKTKWI